MEKKKWEKPQLQVILRSQPEENVLAQCKSVHGPFTNVVLSITGQNCKNDSGRCGACQAMGSGSS